MGEGRGVMERTGAGFHSYHSDFSGFLHSGLGRDHSNWQGVGSRKDGSGTEHKSTLSFLLLHLGVVDDGGV